MTHEMFLDEPSAVTLALEAMRTGPFLLEMPTVFGLFAPPTRSGVRWLNTAKARLPNKTYGTVLGRLRSFHALAMPGSLPSCFDDVEQLRALEGAFLRMRVADETVNTPVLRGGTHQSLLIREGPHRQFFREMEKALAGEAEPELFGGWRCSALLCTSANVSGHSEGSITDLSRARAFAREHGIELLIRSSERALALGSYPILAFHPEHVSVARVGPGLEDIARLLPEGLLER